MIRNYFLSILFCICSTGCREVSKENIEVKNDSISEVHIQIPSSIIIYKHYLNTLDTTSAGSTTLAAQKFQQLFSKANTNEADTAYALFETFYETVTGNINDLLIKDSTDYSPLITLDENGKPLPVPVKVKRYNDSLLANGFQIADDGEANAYIKQERDFINKWFYPSLSLVLKIYLDQENKENKEGFQADAGLTISPQILVDRAVWWENFTNTHPKFVLKDKAIENKKYYLFYLLVGMDNTGVTDYLSNDITDYFKDAYSYLLSKYPASQTAKLVYPYYQALLQKNNSQAEALLKSYYQKNYFPAFAIEYNYLTN